MEMRFALALVALVAGCERSSPGERDSATAGDAPSPAIAAPSAPSEAPAPLARASGSADASCPTRATCGSVVPGGAGLTFAASYCQGDLCRSARSKSECEARDVVKDCNAIVAGTDGRPDCRWDDRAASHGIACRPNK